ncbi:MW1434 family type I TA system toxin [Xenorhabdus griffiniae]|uniref:Thoeris anti-defense Tad2 family protein n=1 Tax=Xenorhabdus griffiniae TaxID=351672 RepID=UPI0030D0987D
MSVINKSDSNIAQQCSFTPDQFKVNVTTKIDNDITAPIGSFPWALIQVYLGKKVYRRNWSYPVEYIHLVSDSSPLIEKRNQGNITTWQPTPEDLTACDWELQGDPNLEFDLTVGVGIFERESNPPWGYVDKNQTYLAGLSSHIGSLKLIKNNSDINNINIKTFFWPYNENLTIRIPYDNNQENGKKMVELFSKNLTVMVDNVHYILGKNTGYFWGNGNELRYELYYNGDINSDLKKLGDQVKKNVGKTLRLRLVWNDN